MLLYAFSSGLIARLAIGFTLITLEVLFLSMLVDASTLEQSSNISFVLAESGNLLRWAIVSVGIFTILTGFNSQLTVRSLIASSSMKLASTALVINLVFFVLLAGVTYQIFGHHTVNNGYLLLFWALLVVLTFCSWGLIIATPSAWYLFLKEQFGALLVSVASGAVIVALGFYFQRYWILLTEFTLGSVHTILSLFYSELVYDFANRNIGLEEFWVNIDSSCSGIEGIVLAAATTLFYLILARNYILFPRALLLVPLACLISVALNIVRITSLIVLGGEVSPALAIGGFHSVAGWIAAVLVALLIIFLFSSWSWLQKHTPSAEKHISKSSDEQIALAILIPFVLFLGTTLLLQVFKDSFDYIYPVKIIVTLVALIAYWKHYTFTPPAKLLESIIIGLLIAIVWVLLIPENNEQDLAFSTAMSDMSMIAAIGWGVFRLIGFIAIAPILEELVFRGYLINRLSGQTINLNKSPRFAIFAFVASAILFGLIHTEWIAGIAAGLLFALVRYRAGTITSCIATHATANILVLLWAFYTGRWSLV